MRVQGIDCVLYVEPPGAACAAIEEFRHRITGQQPMPEVVAWFGGLPEDAQQGIIDFAEDRLRCLKDSWQVLADSPFVFRED